MKNCIIIFSHSNYLVNTGGTEKSISEITKVFKDKNISTIHFFPMRRINQLITKLNTRFIGVNINNEFYGVYPEKKLKAVISEIIETYNYKISGVHIHHLYGWDRMKLATELKEINIPVIFFVHDFELIKSTSMTGNQNQESNFKNSEKFFDLINSLLKRIVVPSDFVRDNWVKYFPDYEKIINVRSHLKFKGKYYKNDINQPLKIAYIGALSNHKGVEEWNKLINDLVGEKYEFYYFGNSKTNNNRVINREVDFQKESNLNSFTMEEMLRKDNIDIVFMWSKLPETYSYTFYEALASGSYILTNRQSGNICQMVKTLNCGRVFKTLSESFDFLYNEEDVILNLNEYRKKAKAPKFLLPNTDINYLLFDNEDVFFLCNHKEPKPLKNKILTFLYQKHKKINNIHSERIKK